MSGGSSDEWYTPKWFIGLVCEALGAIDLDPASCEVAQQVAKANQFFTAEDDGLARPWYGRVYLNPPYSRGLVDKFVAKFSAEYRAKHITAGIVLTNACLETHWMQPLTELAPSACCWPRGRISFWNPSKSASGRPARQPQIVLYAGPYVGRFVSVFSRIGSCWTPWRNAA